MSVRITNGVAHDRYVADCNALDENPTCGRCGGEGYIVSVIGYANGDPPEQEADECPVCEGDGRGNQWLPEHERHPWLFQEGIDQDGDEWTVTAPDTDERHLYDPDVANAPDCDWCRPEPERDWRDTLDEWNERETRAANRA